METQQNESKWPKTPNPGSDGCERLDKFLAECQVVNSGERNRELEKFARELREQAAGGDCAFYRRCRKARPECSAAAGPYPSEDYKKFWTKDSMTQQKADYGILKTMAAAVMDD